MTTDRPMGQLHAHTCLFSLVPDRCHFGTDHYWGVPPRADEPEQAEPMPRARLVILGGANSGIEMYRIAADGRFAGDTWHQTLEEVKSQAVFEFAIDPAGWRVHKGAFHDALKTAARSVGIDPADADAKIRAARGSFDVLSKDKKHYVRSYHQAMTDEVVTRAREWLGKNPDEFKKFE